MPRSRVTLRDVAAHAGVSHMTVSRVINGSLRVSQKTRTRVETAIAELGYSPDVIARSMAQGRSFNLACLSPNLTDYTFANIIEGAETHARQLGYFLFTSSAPDMQTFAALLDQFVASRRADGLLVINPYDDERHTLLPHNFPVVFVGAHSRTGNISSVTLNDETAGKLATQHLIDHSHKRIGMITGPSQEDCVRDRCLGYQSALHASGIGFDPALVIKGDWSATSGYQAFMKLTEENPPPTAIFAQNDRMAIGALRAAQDIGLTVPDQLSVIGVDDMPLASYFDPPLTTLRQDMCKIGQQAAGLLARAIENPDSPAKHLRIPAELVPRKSTTYLT